MQFRGSEACLITYLDLVSYQAFFDFSSRALHLRFEKGMVGLSFCDFVGTREEKVKMAEYRKEEWPRRYKVNHKSNIQVLVNLG